MRKDSQDVGLEAAIIERVRNSSLVECARTDNVTRLKHHTEALECLTIVAHTGDPAREEPAREARREALVGERCAPPRSPTARTGGARTRANAGMSSVMDVRTIHTECLRVPGQRQSPQGESGPKPRTSSRRRWKAGQRILHQSASLRSEAGTR